MRLSQPRTSLTKLKVEISDSFRDECCKFDVLGTLQKPQLIFNPLEIVKVDYKFEQDALELICQFFRHQNVENLLHVENLDV